MNVLVAALLILGTPPTTTVTERPEWMELGSGVFGRSAQGVGSAAIPEDARAAAREELRKVLALALRMALGQAPSLKAQLASIDTRLDELMVEVPVELYRVGSVMFAMVRADWSVLAARVGPEAAPHFESALKQLVRPDLAEQKAAKAARPRPDWVGKKTWIEGEYGFAVAELVGIKLAPRGLESIVTNRAVAAATKLCPPDPKASSGVSGGTHNNIQVIDTWIDAATNNAYAQARVYLPGCPKYEPAK